MKTAALQIFTIQFDKHKDNEGTVVGDRNIKYSGLCKHVNASRESARLDSRVSSPCVTFLPTGATG